MRKVYIVTHGFVWEGSVIESVHDSWIGALAEVKRLAVVFDWDAQIGGRMERDHAIWRHGTQHLAIDVWPVASHRAD